MFDRFNVTSFYDDLALDYHLLFADWSKSIDWQGSVLDKLIQAEMRSHGAPLHVLDCACGIGTQAIALAKRGSYIVHGTDISARSVERARAEAAQAGVNIPFEVADMRALSSVVEGQFDVVIAFDNAIPHLLTDEDLHAAARELRAKTRPGGIVMASIRNYDELLEERPEAMSPRVLDTPQGKRIVFQVWDWEDETYKVTQFIVLPQNGEWEMRYFTTRYRALRRDKLAEALKLAGFTTTRWLMPEDDAYYQPVIVAGD